MRLILTTAVASFAIMTAACNNTADDTAEANMSDDMAMNDMAMNDMAMNDMAMNDMNMAGDMATPMTAASFVATIAGGNMYEIEVGKLAQTMAMNEASKKMGGMLVTDHTKQQDMLKTAAAASTPAVMLPTAMPAEHKAHLDALKAAKGAEFDRVFLAQQKESHAKMLAALKSYAASGDSASLKAFAAKAVPGVEKHNEMVTSMKM
jgi:putative membrane protein